MLASYRWLQELSGVSATPSEVAEALTRAGIEVEASIEKGKGLEHIVVAEVRGSKPHPERDKLSLVKVYNGREELEIVCGASNVPAPGGSVALAGLGAKLPNGIEIVERKLGGLVSRGMLCGETELDLGSDDSGLLLLDGETDAKPGTPLVEALPLADVVFELGVTPNRPDCLGHIGLARELALLFDTKFSKPKRAAPRELVKSKGWAANDVFDLATLWGKARAKKAAQQVPEPRVSVAIKDAAACGRYGAAFVSGAKVARSPFWLRYRLHVLGLRALSNIVDATNLVLLEYGHPIHAFDLECLHDHAIIVRKAKTGESMHTLDAVERKLDADDLLICDAKGPVALAGVMGGAESEIRDVTSEVLIECAYFDPRSVRRSAKRQGLHTDSSHRFERGVDPQAIPEVLARAASLIAELSGGVAGTHGIDVIASPYQPVQIELKQQRLERLLGTSVAQTRVVKILEALGCEVKRRSAEEIDVVVPSWRPDLLREADLIEEVARIEGYDSIPTSVPRVRPSAAGTPKSLVFQEKMRSLAAAQGLSEAITYSFVSPAELEALGLRSKAVPLANPLSVERSVMRTSLLPGLLSVASHSLRRQVEGLRLFELGRVFEASAQALPQETLRFGLILAGNQRPWLGEARSYDFYAAKGKVDALCRALVGCEGQWSAGSASPEGIRFLHPKRCGVLRFEDQIAGFAGELHPALLEESSLSTRVVYAELDVARLFEFAERRGDPQISPLPRFPAVMRDVALLISKEHSAAGIGAEIKNSATALIESVEVFDVYEGEGIPEGKRSLAFRLVYRDPDDTLTDKRVDQVHAKVVSVLEKRFDATIR